MNAELSLLLTEALVIAVFSHAYPRYHIGTRVNQSQAED